MNPRQMNDIRFKQRIMDTENDIEENTIRDACVAYESHHLQCYL